MYKLRAGGHWQSNFSLYYVYGGRNANVQGSSRTVISLRAVIELTDLKTGVFRTQVATSTKFNHATF